MLYVRYPDATIAALTEGRMEKDPWAMQVCQPGEGVARVDFVFTEPVQVNLEQFSVHGTELGFPSVAELQYTGSVFMELNVVHDVGVKCRDQTYTFTFAIMDELTPLSPDKGPVITLTLRPFNQDSVVSIIDRGLSLIADGIYAALGLAPRLPTSFSPTSPSYTPASPSYSPTYPTYTPSPGFSPVALDHPTTSPLFRPSPGSPKPLFESMPTIDLATLSSFGPILKRSQHRSKRRPRASPYVPTRFGAVTFRGGQIAIKKLCL
jgi:hypothetical protein